jgi:hypothetical protein
VGRWHRTANDDDAIAEEVCLNRFASAYIYHRMEVDVQRHRRNLPAAVVVVPISTLADASGGGATTARGWWQFWKQG